MDHDHDRSLNPTLKIAKHKKRTWKKNYIISYFPSSLLRLVRSSMKTSFYCAMGKLTTSIEP
jgi:hypothetical protein